MQKRWIGMRLELLKLLGEQEYSWLTYETIAAHMKNIPEEQAEKEAERIITLLRKKTEEEVIATIQGKPFMRRKDDIEMRLALLEMCLENGVSQSFIETVSNHMKSIPDDQKEEEAEYIMNLLETKSEKELIMLLLENDQLTRYKITT